MAASPTSPEETQPLPTTPTKCNKRFHLPALMHREGHTPSNPLVGARPARLQEPKSGSGREGDSFDVAELFEPAGQNICMPFAMRKTSF